MRTNTIDFFTNVVSFVEIDDQRFLQSAKEDAAAVDRYLAQYERLATTDRHRQNVSHFTELWHDYRELGQKLLDKKAHKRESIQQLSDLRISLISFVNDEMQPEAAKNLEARRNAMVEDARSIVRLALILPLVCLVIAVVTSVALARAVIQSERNIIEQAERLRTTLASIGDAVITTDIDGRITNFNAIAESLTGWKSADALGQPLDAVFRIVNEKTRHLVENPATRALKQSIVAGGENHILLLGKDGSERPIEDCAAPIRCDAGEVIGCVLVFRDVTDRRRAEMALRKSEEHARTILESIGDAFFALDKDWRFTYANHQSEKLLQRNPGDLIGKILWDEYPGFVGSEFEQAYQRAMIQRVSVSVSAFYADHDRWYEMSLYPSPDGLSVYFRDISERQRAEQRVRESETRLSMALSAANMVGWHLNPSTGKLALDNASDLFGLLPGRTFDMSEDWFDLLHPDDVEQHREIVLKAVQEKGSYISQFRMIRPVNQAVIWLEERGLVVGDDDGQTLRLVGVAMDITDRKLAEEKLRQLASDLSEASQRKDEFIATLAHELRNPLAPIRNGLQLMHLAKGESQLVEDVRTMMERQLKQLIRLVDDLLDVSRISRGKMELRMEKLLFQTVIRSAIETSLPLIEEMGHELTLTLPADQVEIEADMIRLAQVFSNLLNNAAKYSNRGGHIQITAEQLASGLNVTVSDTGIGIAADQLPCIFNMFTQVDRTLERSQSGLGIGLTLVKRLVEMHGGNVVAKSAGPGKGSEFIVHLPVVSSSSSPIVLNEEMDATKGSLRILIVDDNRDGANSLSMMLRISGNDTRTAYDGQEGIEVAEAFRPDVMLLDIGMPKLNGYEACRRIREQHWGKDVVLVAVTGWGQLDDRLRSVDAGFDHHLVKPVDPQALMKLLTEFEVMNS